MNLSKIDTLASSTYPMPWHPASASPGWPIWQPPRIPTQSKQSIMIHTQSHWIRRHPSSPVGLDSDQTNMPSLYPNRSQLPAIGERGMQAKNSQEQPRKRHLPKETNPHHRRERKTTWAGPRNQPDGNHDTSGAPKCPKLDFLFLLLSLRLPESLNPWDAF